VTEAEFRDFMREQTLRHERASRSTEAWLRIADRRTREMIKRGDETIAELRDLREEFKDESRAQRAALFAMMDRLDPGSSAV